MADKDIILGHVLFNNNKKKFDIFFFLFLYFKNQINMDTSSIISNKIATMLQPKHSILEIKYVYVRLNNFAFDYGADEDDYNNHLEYTKLCGDFATGNFKYIQDDHSSVRLSLLQGTIYWGQPLAEFLKRKRYTLQALDFLEIDPKYSMNEIKPICIIDIKQIC